MAKQVNSSMFILIIWIYQFFRAFRYTVLSTIFGYVSHCQQNPSCGTFFFRTYKTKGLLTAILETTPRFLTCGVVHKNPISTKRLV